MTKAGFLARQRALERNDDADDHSCPASRSYLGSFGMPPLEPQFQPVFADAMIAALRATCVMTAGLSWLGAAVGWVTQPASSAAG